MCHVKISKRKTGIHQIPVFLFGSGTRIRTLNGRVRVASVTVTLCRYVWNFIIFVYLHNPYGFLQILNIFWVKKEQKQLQFRGFCSFWQKYKDYDFKWQSQSLSCYHYTILQRNIVYYTQFFYNVNIKYKKIIYFFVLLSKSGNKYSTKAA